MAFRRLRRRLLSTTLDLAEFIIADELRQIGQDSPAGFLVPGTSAADLADQLTDRVRARLPADGARHGFRPQAGPGRPRESRAGGSSPK